MTTLKEEGIAKVSANNVYFLALMRTQAAWICKKAGSVTISQLRRYADKQGVKPTHPNAWGAVFAGRKWTKIGYTQSTIKSAHHRVVGIWTIT